MWYACNCFAVTPFHLLVEFLQRHLYQFIFILLSVHFFFVKIFSHNYHLYLKFSTCVLTMRYTCWVPNRYQRWFFRSTFIIVCPLTCLCSTGYDIQQNFTLALFYFVWPLPMGLNVFLFKGNQLRGMFEYTWCFVNFHLYPLITSLLFISKRTRIWASCRIIWWMLILLSVICRKSLINSSYIWFILGYSQRTNNLSLNCFELYLQGINILICQ